MQKIRTLLVWAGVTLSFFGFGQTATDSTQIQKWEIGIDLLGLIDKNKVPEASIFIRRNYGFRNNKCKALRFRIGMDTEKRLVKAWDGHLIDDYKGYSPYIAFGHEWKTIFPKYRWFFGIDVVGSFTRSNQYYSVGSTTYYYDTIRNYTIGLNGLTGFQMNLTKYLSITLESAALIKYEKKYLYSRDLPWSQGGENSKRFFTKIEPIMVLNLIYSLQKHKKNVKK